MTTMDLIDKIDDFVNAKYSPEPDEIHDLWSLFVKLVFFISYSRCLMLLLNSLWLFLGA